MTAFVEIGTGKVLSGLVKRTLEDVAIANLDGADDLDRFWPICRVSALRGPSLRCPFACHEVAGS